MKKYPILVSCPWCCHTFNACDATCEQCAGGYLVRCVKCEDYFRLNAKTKEVET